MAGDNALEDAYDPAEKSSVPKREKPRNERILFQTVKEIAGNVFAARLHQCRSREVELNLFGTHHEVIDKKRLILGTGTQDGG